MLQYIASKNLQTTLLVDSLGLHKTLATQVTPKDMSAIYDIHSLRLDFESGVTGLLEELLSTGRVPVNCKNLPNYGKAKIEEPLHWLPSPSDVKEGVLTTA